MVASTLPALALAAAILDVTVGYPPALYNAIGHPVTWMGAWLSWLEARLNVAGLGFSARRAAGGIALIAYLAPVAAALPAQQSLDRHVRAVALGLERDGLEAGRAAVSMIVGRNPRTLDEA